jgi:hypothetical protein
VELAKLFFVLVINSRPCLSATETRTNGKCDYLHYRKFINGITNAYLMLTQQKEGDAKRLITKLWKKRIGIKKSVSNLFF